MLVCLVSTAQAEDRGFLRNDSAATLQGTNLEPSSASVNSVGALQCNIDSAFQTGTSLIRSEDAAHSSGHPGVMALAVLNSGLNVLAGTDGDYSPIAVGARGDVFTTLWYDSAIGASGPIQQEDTSIGESQPLIMAGARRVDSLSSNPGASGDAGYVNQTADGALWVSVVPAVANGATPSRQSALSTTVQTVKGSAGQLYSYHCFNAAAATSYVQIFDTSGAVTLGTTTPALSLGLPAGGAGNLHFTTGVAFANAIKVAATTTATGSSAPGTAVDCNFTYK